MDRPRTLTGPPGSTGIPGRPGPLARQPCPTLTPTTPSIARVYDYLLHGKDNFAVDREVAEKLMAVAPLAADVTRENRQFLARAVAIVGVARVG